MSLNRWFVWISFTQIFFLINIGSMNIHHCPGVFLSEAGEFSDFEFRLMENITK